MEIARRFVSSLVLGLLLTSLTGCGGDGDGAATGASVSLGWDPVNNPNVSAYTVHYGRQSSGQHGSCDYENSIDVAFPAATVTGLDPDSIYYFAVSVYNANSGERSHCSNEVSTVTPPGQRWVDRLNGEDKTHKDRKGGKRPGQDA